MKTVRWPAPPPPSRGSSDPDTLAVRILALRAELLQTLTPGIIHHLANAGQGLVAAESFPGALDRVAARLEKAKRIITTLMSELGMGEAADTGTSSASVDEVLAEIEVWQSCQILLPRVRVVFLPHPTLPNARIRPDHLRDALAAIVTNAKEALAAAPAGEIRISARADDTWVTITVVDDGPGIALVTLARLFEPYNSTKLGGHHLGLGLSVASEILMRAGGDLSVASSIEAPHTRIRMRIPVVPGTTGSGSGSTAQAGGDRTGPPRTDPPGEPGQAGAAA